MLDLDAHPSVLAARASEDAVRAEAFLGLGSVVCGISLAPLTLRRLHRLLLIDSPFIVGGRPPGPADVAVFLWALHPHYSPGARWRRWWFTRRLRRLPFIEACSQIASIVDDALMDRPPTSGSGGGSLRVDLCAAVGHRLACAYGGGMDAALDLPCAAVWQLLRLLRVEDAAKQGQTVPTINVRSDKARRLLLDTTAAAASDKPQPA